MKKGNLLVCAMLVMCQLSLAQVSRDSAYAILKTDILDSTWIEKEIYVSKETLLGGDTIFIGSSFVVIPNFECWFFFVNEEPFANLPDCKFVFIDKENGNQVVIPKTTLIPMIVIEMDLLNSVRIRKNTYKKSFFRIPKSRNTTTSDN